VSRVNDRAPVTLDVLSDVLRAVRLTGAVYFDLDLGAPWVADTPPARAIAGMVMPGAQRVIPYHILAGGSGWWNLAGGEPARLEEGDVVVFPQGDGHVMSSAPGLKSTPDLSRYARPSTALPLAFELGGGGPERARMICCFMGLDERPYNPLLSALPPGAAKRGTWITGGGGWLRPLLDAALAHSARSSPGGGNVLERLSELMFVEAVRRHLGTLPPEKTGWLAGLNDPLVGQALAELHAAPREAWTVESLARRVGASRSLLAERFNELVGQPPMQYLALWRMQLAARRLADGGRVADVATGVGYESEAAFSRAFKKLVGRSPAAWRRGAET
jgi:AraC-like DNA-binding protein